MKTLRSNMSSTTAKKVASDYKGFDIIKVKTTYFCYSSFYKCYDARFIDKTETHYTFCKAGMDKKPSQRYNAYADRVESCKKLIDQFLEDDSLFFTEEERNKYVYNPNRKNRYAFSYKSIMQLMKQHKNGTKRMQRLLEDRLESANFHSFCGLLSQKRYDEFEQLAAKELTINERFVVRISTEIKGVSTDKKFTDGLQKVVEDYVKSLGLTPNCIKVEYLPWES